jgi:hypothetical protein
MDTGSRLKHTQHYSVPFGDDASLNIDFVKAHEEEYHHIIQHVMQVSFFSLICLINSGYAHVNQTANSQKKSLTFITLVIQ